MVACNAGKDIRGVSAWLMEARPFWQGADDVVHKANPVFHKSAVMVRPSKGSSMSAEINAIFETVCQLVESFRETCSILLGYQLPIEVHTDSETGLRCIARVTTCVDNWAVGALRRMCLEEYGASGKDVTKCSQVHSQMRFHNVKFCFVSDKKNLADGLTKTRKEAAERLRIALKSNRVVLSKRDQDKTNSIWKR